MKIWKIVGILALVMALSLSSVGSAFASPALQEEGEKVGLFGVLVSIEDDVVTINTNKGPVEIVITEETDIFVPPNRNATIEDLEADGSVRVAISAVREGELLVATSIMRIPGEPVVHSHVVGVVVSTEDGTITLEDDQGNTFTLEVPQGVLEAAVGNLLTVVSENIPGQRNPVARGGQPIEQVIERLNRRLDDIVRRATEEIEREVRRATQEAQRLAREAAEEAQGRADEARQLAGEARQRAQERADEARQRAEELAAEARAHIANLVHESRHSHEEQEAKARAIERLTELLERNSARNVEILNALAERLPEGSQARLAVERAIEAALRGRQAALDAITRIRHASDSELGRIRGIIQDLAVDPETGAQTVTIAFNEEHTITLTVTEDTEIEKDDNEEATFADLEVGDIAVKAFYDHETLEARKLVVRSPRPVEIEGFVDAVDPDPENSQIGEITIIPIEKFDGVSIEGDPITLTVTPDTRLEKDDVDVFLSDLKEGDIVKKAIYDPQTHVALRLDIESPVEGALELFEVEELKFEGTIDSFTTDELVLVDGPTFVIAEDVTDIKGTLALDAKTKVKAMSIEGILYALEIEVEEEIGLVALEQVTLEFKGTIDSISETEVVVDGQTVFLNGAVIDGTLEVGVYVEVRAIQQEDGTLLALEIEV